MHPAPPVLSSTTVGTWTLTETYRCLTESIDRLLPMYSWCLDPFFNCCLWTSCSNSCPRWCFASTRRCKHCRIRLFSCTSYIHSERRVLLTTIFREPMEASSHLSLLLQFHSTLTSAMRESICSVFVSGLDTPRPYQKNLM